MAEEVTKKGFGKFLEWISGTIMPLVVKGILVVTPVSWFFAKDFLAEHPNFTLVLLIMTTALFIVMTATTFMFRVRCRKMVQQYCIVRGYWEFC